MRPLLLLALLTALLVPAVADPAGAGGPLEEIEVTTADDVVDAGDGVTSLREAFALAEDDGVMSRLVLDTVEYDLVCQGIHGAHLAHDAADELMILGNGATITQTCPGHSVIEDTSPRLTIEALIVTGGSHEVLAAVHATAVDFTEVRVEDNTVSGGVHLTGADVESWFSDSLVTRNTMATVGAGGINSEGDVQLVGTIVSANTSTACCNSAGGVVAYEVDMIDSTIGPFNEGSVGGVLAWDALSMRLSTVVANVSTGVGGGAMSLGDLDVSNSAVVDNSAATQAGGLRSSGLLTLEHATVVDNAAPTVGNVLSTGGMELRASVVAKADGGGGSCGAYAGGFTSHGYNLLDPVEAGCTDPSATTDISGHPMLGRLRDNGPTVETLFPIAGSPLVDAIPAAECTTDIDQRDIARPFGPGCDIGAVEQVYPPHGFGDVGPWVEDAVRWITSTVNDPPLMIGMTPTAFRPGNDITRAQVVRMLHREAGSPDAGAYPPHGFRDVPPWVEDAVRWAAGEEIATGWPNGTFRPNRPISRAQVVRMKYRLAGSPPVDGLPAHGFPDGQPWFEDALRWAANTDNPLPLITGYPNGTFQPSRSITRGQVVRMDYRLALTPQAWADADNAPPTVPFQSQN